jgi:hypothetical protein
MLRSEVDGDLVKVLPEHGATTLKQVGGRWTVVMGGGGLEVMVVEAKHCRRQETESSAKCDCTRPMLVMNWFFFECLRSLLVV